MVALGPTWVRWNGSKWHHVNDAFESTLCGEWLNHAEYDTKETYGVPVDEHAVCIRCMRAVEKRNRDKEKGLEL